MTTDAQKKASAKYKKANTKNITVSLSLKYDRDIIAYLETVKNKNDLIKRLLRFELSKK